MTLHSDLLRIDPASSPLFVGRVSEAGESDVVRASGLEPVVVGAIHNGILLPDGARVVLRDEGFFEVLSYVMPHDVLVTSLHDDRDCPHLGAWLLSRRDSSKDSDDRQMVDASSVVHLMLDRSELSHGTHFLIESFGQWAIKVTNGHLSVSTGKRHALVSKAESLEDLARAVADGGEPFLMVCWLGDINAAVRPTIATPSLAKVHTTDAGQTFLEVEREFFTGLEHGDVSSRLDEILPDARTLVGLSGLRICLKNDRQRGLAWAALADLLDRLNSSYLASSEESSPTSRR